MLCLSTINTQAELFIIFYSCIDSPSVKCFAIFPLIRVIYQVRKGVPLQSASAGLIPMRFWRLKISFFYLRTYL